MLYSRTIDINQHTKHSLEHPEVSTIQKKSIDQQNKTLFSQQKIHLSIDKNDDKDSTDDEDTIDDEATIEDNTLTNDNDDDNDDNHNTKSFIQVKKKKKSKDEMLQEHDIQLAKDLQEEKKLYQRYFVDYKAVKNLFINAFRLKNSSKDVSDNQIAKVCSNVSFTMCYFGNDFKSGVFTDCLEKHVGTNSCGKSVYGYTIPDERKKPSRENIARTEDVCMCHHEKIRRLKQQ